MTLKPSSVPLLGMLTWRPMTGYDLKNEIDGSLGNFWSESFGQIYPQLKALNETGLIEKVPSEISGSSTKTPFAITDAGRAALAEWISVEPANRPPRDELLLKIFFASEGDAHVVRDHCRKAREEAVARLRTFEGIGMKLDVLGAGHAKAKYWRMTLNLGISQTRNFISWCDETVAAFATHSNTEENQS